MSQDPKVKEACLTIFYGSENLDRAFECLNLIQPIIYEKKAHKFPVTRNFF